MPMIYVGPVGWTILGAAGEPESSFSWDCWKPIVHCTSGAPSSSILLRDIVLDPRVKKVTVTPSAASKLPDIRIQNIWDEHFKIDFVMLPSNQLAAHAVQIT